MLERPSNIFERVKKGYETFNRFITCYNGLYDNVIRCPNRSNILFLTCCTTCCMTCLNGLLRLNKRLAVVPRKEIRRDGGKFSR